MATRYAGYLRTLVAELRALPTETGWVEFKVDQAEPDDVGEYISAIANAAALIGKTCGYVVWGVEDSSHDLVGTTFDHRLEMKMIVVRRAIVAGSENRAERTRLRDGGLQIDQ